MTAAKLIISQELKLPVGKVRARQGRGTARYWLYITTEAPVEAKQRERVEKKLVAAGLCGRYYSDIGPKSDWTPCVLWNTRS